MPLLDPPDPRRPSDPLLPGLRRILAPNPSAMTGPGTNTYLVGTGLVALIDPGPDDPAHAAAILASLGPGERIGHILVTHAHLDHSALAPRLARLTGARVLAFGDATQGRSAVMERLAAAGGLRGGEGLDMAFRPDAGLADGAVLETGDWRIEVLHTPGHMSGHLSFAWEGHLFSGDHAMGWSTSLVSPPDGDMGRYMATTERLLHRPWRSLLPGHGAAVADAGARLRQLRDHRRSRERAILGCVHDGLGTVAEITACLYPDLTPALRAAAARNVLAHLIDLAERGFVVGDPITPTTRFLPPA